ncbi:unnamed protein product [Caenorhabditis sp. 36 PRJEB53466]|nr:unnamed protein product [Caenorhabditis sp. 36 PRJEB53466]
MASLEISKSSHQKFKEYLSGLCVNGFSSEEEYYEHYLDWEESNFLDAVKEFLSEEEAVEPDFFQHFGPRLASRCNVKKNHEVRDRKIIDRGLSENDFYNQMTRGQWTGINL